MEVDPPRSASMLSFFDGSFDFKNFDGFGKLRSCTLHFCMNFEFSSRNKTSYRHKRKPPTRILPRFWSNHTERLGIDSSRSPGAQFQRVCGTCFERAERHNVLKRSRCDHFIPIHPASWIYSSSRQLKWLDLSGPTKPG